MIVRADDFVARLPEWMDDPGAPAELKRNLRELGMVEFENRVGCLEIVDECFNCGGKLTTPYVYWNGATGTLSMHPQCAADLAHGLAQYAFGVSKERRPESGREAARWLDLFASKKEYQIEDEEFPVREAESQSI